MDGGSGCSVNSISCAGDRFALAHFFRRLTPLPLRKKAACRQAIDCRNAHAVGAREISLRLTISKSLDSFLLLMGVKSVRSAETHTTGLCTGSALTGARIDQLTLELGNTSEHGQHEPTVGCGGVCPSIGQ
jgi:hypothetical protein